VVVLAGVAAVLIGLLALRLHPVLALSGAALLVAALAPAAQPAAARVTEAFGATAGKLGLLVAFGAVVGEGLGASGAARRLARAALRVAGPGRADVALAGAAFVLSVPVFFDSLFLLLCPLARAVGRATGRGRLLPVLAVVAGGTMAHTLVPPTPGPLFVAQALGVDLGTMMIAGAAVGVVAVAAGLIFARGLAGRMRLPEPEGDAADAPGVAPPAAGPPLPLAATPVVLPIALILAGVDRTLALGLGAAAALALVARHAPGGARAARTAAAAAMERAGVVVLVIAAGGAFGAALRAADVGAALARVGAGGRGLLLLGFAAATALRTLQGSATVAMMATAGMVADLARPPALPCDPVWLALAIGCGAKNLAWMNDAGFWIIARTAQLTERQTLRSVSVMNVVMGLAALAAVLLGSYLVPLAHAGGRP
jgi:GntP family gluconate:H+ symporter